ncbi:phytosulfokines 6 [Olea europaea subsp. europaea]|nr:phytosulfokines 6 [Olea europaea subsp. europaea]
MLIIFQASARLLPKHQGDHPNSRANGIAEEDEVIPSLMGLEECDEKDVACQNRRMLADAHLDYIYTQQHKP